MTQTHEAIRQQAETMLFGYAQGHGQWNPYSGTHVGAKEHTVREIHGDFLDRDGQNTTKAVWHEVARIISEELGIPTVVVDANERETAKSLDPAHTAIVKIGEAGLFAGPDGGHDVRLTYSSGQIGIPRQAFYDKVYFQNRLAQGAWYGDERPHGAEPAYPDRSAAWSRFCQTRDSQSAGMTTPAP